MKFLVFGLIASLFFAADVLSQSALDSKKVPPSPPPKVLIETAPDSPMRVTAKTEWVNVTPGIQLDITVRNTSEKAIRAYAMRPRVGSDESANCFLLHTIKPGRVLQPGQSEVRTTWRGYPYDSQSPVHLSLDFIEFTDDSTWGADGCQSAASLAGMRAGARKVTEVLETIFAEGGGRAVVEALGSIRGEIETPNIESAIWQSGYRSGIEGMIQRLRELISDVGLSEVGAALKQPYDASGYKIEVVKSESP